MKIRKKSTLKKYFFKKYLISFVIFQIIFQLFINGSMYVLKNHAAKNFVNCEYVYNDIDQYGYDSVIAQSDIRDKAYIEILDLDYNVKKSKNSPHATGYKYSDKEISEIANKKIEDVELFFLSKTQELVIIKSSSMNKNVLIFVIAVLLLLVILIIAYIFFFKVMAKIAGNSLIKPLQSLKDGIDRFKSKEYSHRINFFSNNEFDDLKDAFNSMAATIESEIKLRKEAESINKQLILDITHDLKTPLTSIEGYSELLKEGKDLPEKLRKQYLDIIIANSKRTNKLIKDLFDITYYDYKDFTFQKEKTDLCEFLRRLLVEYVVMFEDNNKKYEFDIPEQAIWVDLDKKMIDRAICNILNNFIKYSGENTTISITLEKTSSGAVLTIIDDGMGISKEKCESIFLPFVREDSSRNTMNGGTGLGLAISKKIIEKHGGNIKLVSEKGKGCEFKIEFNNNHACFMKNKVKL